MITVNKANPTPGEVTSSLTGSTGDGSGLHFDGAAGHILREVASAPAVGLGTKFSLEYVVKADEWKTTGGQHFLVDFGDGGRVIFGTGNFDTGGISGNLGIYSNSAWGDQDFGVKVLDDLKVHHLVVTVDGTAASLFDNGNLVGTTTIGATDIDSCKDFAIGSAYSGSAHFFNGTIFRCRFYNHTLSTAEVQTAFERADVQYGRQPDLVTNGEFTEDANWTHEHNWAIADGKAKAPSVAANQQIYQAVSLTAGKKYKIEFEISDYSAGGVILHDIVGQTTPTYNSNGYHSFEFTAAAGSNFVNFRTVGTTTLNIEYVKLHEIGCVTDYDFSNANPSISRTIQDRNREADGTASATGVVQVNPILQGNFTSLAVTTSQQAAGVPADGEVVADTVSVTGTGHDAAKITITNTASANARLLLNSGHGNWSVCNSDTVGDALEFRDESANATRLTIASDGNIEQHTDTNGITKFVVKNETTGTSARALVQAVSDGANMDLWANSASYTGVAGWADSGVISTGSTTSGGMKINAVAGGLSLQTNQSARLTIAYSTGLATFSGGINLGNQTMSSYQTGVWYPHLYYQNPTGVTIGGTAYALQAVSDYTEMYGHYVKVGKLVHVEGYLKVTTANASSFANDNIGIQGLPFSHRNATNANAMLMVNTTGASGTIASGVVAPNGTIAVLQTSSGGSNLADDIGAVTDLKIWINGTYFTEA